MPVGAIPVPCQLVWRERKFLQLGPVRDTAFSGRFGRPEEELKVGRAKLKELIHPPGKPAGVLHDDNYKIGSSGPAS